MATKKCFLIAVVLFILPLSNAFAQCRSAVRGTSADVSHFYRGIDSDPVNGDYNSDVNRNLRDYGIIFEDAGNDA